jgi:hypothetical protein
VADDLAPDPVVADRERGGRDLVDPLGAGRGRLEVEEDVVRRRRTAA